MTMGREFDVAIIRVLLLPLYNSTHDTNYVLSGFSSLQIPDWKSFFYHRNIATFMQGTYQEQSQIGT